MTFICAAQQARRAEPRSATPARLHPVIPAKAGTHDKVGASLPGFRPRHRCIDLEVLSGRANLACKLAAVCRRSRPSPGHRRDDGNGLLLALTYTLERNRIRDNRARHVEQRGAPAVAERLRRRGCRHSWAFGSTRNLLYIAKTLAIVPTQGVDSRLERQQRS